MPSEKALPRPVPPQHPGTLVGAPASCLGIHLTEQNARSIATRICGAPTI
jgi:hypothetical protein